MRLLPVLLLSFFTSPAYAYIGPGIGLGAIAGMIAIVLGFLFLFGALVWFPIKRKLKQRRVKDK